MKNTDNVKAAAADTCKSSRIIYLKGGRPLRTECTLPRGHSDAPLLSKQSTHHDAVYGLSWKGRGK